MKGNNYIRQINALNKLKIALVHEAFIEYGGAEKLFSRLTELFPGADIYVTAADPRIGNKITRRSYNTSFLNWIPVLNRKHSFVQLFGFLFERFRSFRGYDLIITNSSYGAACLVNTDAVKVDFLQSPPKNIYGLVPGWKVQRFIPYSVSFRRLVESEIRKSDLFIANSRHCQSWFKKNMGREPMIVYPPIDIPSPSIVQRQSSNYFITASRLSPEKNIDLIIKAFNKFRLPLKIVGVGKDKARLQSMAGASIEFLGFIDEQKLRKLFADARGFVFAAENEDFGMAPLEAIACGCPMVSYAGGGPLEYVVEAVNGILFRRVTVSSLVRAINQFEKTHFDRRKVAKTATRFSLDNFNQNFVGAIWELMHNKKVL